jgi:hypothetical protein
MTAMEHAKKDYMQNKDREDHRISLYVEAKQESGLSKQGYLYKLRSKLGWQLMYVVLKDGQLTWFKKWKVRCLNFIFFFKTHFSLTIHKRYIY